MKTKICLILGILVVLLIPSTLGIDKGTSTSINQNPPTCNEFLIQISKLNQSLENCTYWLSFYKNQSEYYKSLYLKKSANVTIGYVTKINQNISNIFYYINQINQTINEIRQEINFLRLNFTVSLLTIGSIIGISIKILFDRVVRRKWERERKK